jgi:putative membrane protein
MDSILQNLYTGLPVLITHFVGTLSIFIVAAAIYTFITPHNEIKLIKEGNVAAALSLGGDLIGLALPLAFCLAGSVNIYDLLIWGAVTLVLQLVTFFIIDLMLKGISKSIEEGKLSHVIFLVAVKLCVAMINAAAISG